MALSSRPSLIGIRTSSRQSTSWRGSEAGRGSADIAASLPATGRHRPLVRAATIGSCPPTTSRRLSPTPVGPWRRRSRRLAYENPWIQVHHDEVTRPDGEPGIYGVVHFRTRAVGVVAIDDEDRVILVGQHRYTLDRYTWEIPEGGVPPDEDLLAGARRELREETGCEAAAWREIGAFDTSNSSPTRSACSTSRPG